MRKSRRLVVSLAVSALVASGGIGLGLGLVANAATEIGLCSGTGTPISCTITSQSADTTVNDPSAIQAVVTLIPPVTPSSTATATPSSTATPAPNDLYIQLDYSLECFDSSDNETSTSNLASPNDEHAITTSVTVTLAMGYTNPASCEVISVQGTLETSTDDKTFTAAAASAGSFTLELEWTPTAAASSSSASSSSASVSVIKGYDGKCLDDRGNSSANRAAVIIWGCNTHDSAQGFTYSGGELKHNGKCVNDQGSGGSGTHLILWTCNGASNEKWFHSGSDGEFVLTSQAHGLLCVDDPGNSKTNGTQLIVWKCKNTSNQRWT